MQKPKRQETESNTASSLRSRGPVKLQLRPFQKKPPLSIRPSTSCDVLKLPTVTQLEIMPQDTSSRLHGPGGPSAQMSVDGWSRHDRPRHFQTSLSCVVMHNLVLAH